MFVAFPETKTFLILLFRYSFLFLMYFKHKHVGTNGIKYTMLTMTSKVEQSNLWNFNLLAHSSKLNSLVNNFDLKFLHCKILHL